MCENEAKITDLIGQTLSSVVKNDDDDGFNDELILTSENGDVFKMYHHQDCCESVTIEDICGNLSDLVGSPILSAEECTSDENPEGVVLEHQESFTWTFYNLATIKGSVTIRWYGQSNGYYSESVTFVKC